MKNAKLFVRKSTWKRGSKPFSTGVQSASNSKSPKYLGCKSAAEGSLSEFSKKSTLCFSYWDACQKFIYLLFSKNIGVMYANCSRLSFTSCLVTRDMCKWETLFSKSRAWSQNLTGSNLKLACFNPMVWRGAELWAIVRENFCLLTLWTNESIRCWANLSKKKTSPRAECPGNLLKWIVSWRMRQASR